MRFKSNIENTKYGLFDELCHRLGYDPTKYIKKTRTSEETTYIDTGRYILRRDVFPIGIVEISIVRGDKIITGDDIRKKLFGINPAMDTWWFYSKASERKRINNEYNSQKVERSKIEKIVKELFNFLTA